MLLKYNTEIIKGQETPLYAGKGKNGKMGFLENG